MMAIPKCNIKILTLLIERGANINLEDNLGWTPITRAVDDNKMEIIKVLISQGADLNLKPSHKISALSRAVLKHNLDVVKLLLENGADINLRTVILKNNSIEVALKEKQNSILNMLLHHQL